MVERTLADEIISIVHSEANNNPLPLKCTIHETYSNGLIDVLLENGNIITYLPVIGSPRVGDTGVLLYLDDEKNNQIIITNGGAVGGGSSGTGGSNVDLSNYYTKNETDNLLTGKLNTNLGVANKNVVTDENGNVSLEEKSGNNGFGSFYINDEGHLIAVIPSNVNPYRLGDDGHLYYNTGV